MPGFIAYLWSVYLFSSKLWRNAAVGCCPLMAGSTTGVPMSPGYGEYWSTAYPSYYSTSPTLLQLTTPRLQSTPPPMFQSITSWIAGEKRWNNQSSDNLQHDSNYLAFALFFVNCILRRITSMQSRVNFLFSAWSCELTQLLFIKCQLLHIYVQIFIFY